MESQFEGLSPIVVAALKSPKGTTLEELRARFPEAASARSSAAKGSAEAFKAEFRCRIDEALFEWSKRNSWKVPDDVVHELREEVLWQMERDGWKR